jgi:hypothetical protein
MGDDEGMRGTLRSTQFAAIGGDKSENSNEYD